MLKKSTSWWRFNLLRVAITGSVVIVMNEKEEKRAFLWINYQAKKKVSLSVSEATFKK